MKLWKDFNPDQDAFNEQIVREETKDGVYSHDSLYQRLLPWEGDPRLLQIRSDSRFQQ